MTKEEITPILILPQDLYPVNIATIMYKSKYYLILVHSDNTRGMINISKEAYTNITGYLKNE